MSEYQYPFSTDRSNLLGTEAFRNLLGESLRKSKEKIVILSAYVKEVGVKWLREQINNKNINCTIISRWQKGDLATGSSDLECYSLCKENNWTFKILNDLHAKVMLIDDKDLFIGSPNLTGSGMSLIPVSNKELGIKISANDNDKRIIDGLMEEALLINDEIYEDLKKWKKNLPEIKKPSIPDFPADLKEKIKENFDKIWVHNFPWSAVDDLLNIKDMNENIQHDLELFGLSKDNLNKDNLKNNFENSKIFKWLINQIKKQEKDEIYFGNLSSIIHNSLLDDPKPYRKEVKDLQINLFNFIKILNLKQIKLDRPNFSERITLVSFT